ncbi:hypothetical protein [Aeromicrobium endophyticum]|uniref:Uncharacterized protein n=1 Tax=Aeromicrobium endophyticum TaxID=2292704 RepID=A0A371PCQ2_9ACTN|nr:hypothetical protein DX116_09195 [Aeromicrobium endophyticum]
MLVGPRRTFGKNDPGTLAAQFPKLHLRTGERCRPHTDDEIVLLRIWNLIQSDVGGKHAHKSAAVYAQCDAGLTPTERAMVSVRNVALIPGLGKIDAPGLRSGVAKRTLRLEDVNVHILSAYMAQAPADLGTPLTYRQRADKFSLASAGASADGILKRQRAALGLDHEDVSAASVTLWRAKYTWDNDGIAEATDVSGRRLDNLYGLLLTRVDVKTTPTAPPSKPRMVNI